MSQKITPLYFAKNVEKSAKYYLFKAYHLSNIFTANVSTCEIDNFAP